MAYEYAAIPVSQVPAAREPLFQHLLETYVSETNKVVSTWMSFNDGDLDHRPHARSSTVQEIMRHQLLSERRFFGEFLGSPEPPAAEVLPAEARVESYWRRVAELAAARLPFLAGQSQEWWLASAPFFGESRQRIWIFWRRVLHTAHHRTQLGVYLRLLERPVRSTYGPTADEIWKGADPTHTVDAASRK